MSRDRLTDGAQRGVLLPGVAGTGSPAPPPSAPGAFFSHHGATGGTVRLAAPSGRSDPDAVKTGRPAVADDPVATPAPPLPMSRAALRELRRRDRHLPRGPGGFFLLPKEVKK